MSAYISQKINCSDTVNPFSTNSTSPTTLIEHKIYVSEIPPDYNEDSLYEVFSKFGRVKEIYLHPETLGYRWAFVYYDTEDAVAEALLRFKGNHEYSFKVKLAKPKIKKWVSPETPVNIMKAETNGVPFVTPPNCSFCKKLTFFCCGSCGNSFCNTECSLDGWRLHTKGCVKVAQLHKIGEKKTNPQLSETVIDFMKHMKISQRSFDNDEFATVCSDRLVKEVSNLTGSGINSISSDSISMNKIENNYLNDAKNTSKFHKSIKYDSKMANSFRKDQSYNDTRVKLESRAENVKSTKNYTNTNKENKSPPVDANKKNHFEGKDRRMQPISAPSSLHLAERETKPVIVTLIADEKNLFIADPDQFFDMLGKIVNEDVTALECLDSFKVGAWCFSLYDNHWYRAEIVSIDPLEVVYFDFGNKEKAERNLLKFMPKKYREMKPLARKVRLKSGTVASHNIAENEQILVSPVEYDVKRKVWNVEVI